MLTCEKDLLPGKSKGDREKLVKETKALTTLDLGNNSSDTQITVGYWMIPNYFSKLRMDGFESFCRKSRRIKLHQMNLSDDDMKVDVFLHRIYDVMVSALMGNSDAASFIDHFEKFNEMNPQILTTDSLPGSKALQHRAQFNARLSRTQFGEGIQVPDTQELTSLQHVQTLRVNKGEFSFPLICKPLIAHATDDEGNGSEECHEMMLVFKPDQLALLPYPCVVQNFVDHNATLFKLYVIGKFVHVCIRPSVRNLSGFNSSKVIRFKTKDVSKKNSNTILNFCPNRSRLHEFTDCNGHVPYNMSLQFQAIAEQLKKEFRITLFGADVIISRTTNTFYVIDVNTCPDFYMIDDFWMNLEDLLVYAGRCTKTGDHDALFNHHCHIASFNKF